MNVNLYLLFQYKNNVPSVNKKFKVITLDEFNSFLSVIESKRERLIFSLLFYFGLRITEVLGLRWSDISSDTISMQRCVTAKTYSKKQVVVDPKSASSIRDYSIPKAILFPLNEYRNSYKHKNDDYLFPGDGSLVLGVSTITRLKNEYFVKAGITPIKLHEFRHSCATYLLSSGIPPRVVASWLGHKSEVVTLSTYSHVIPGEKNKITSFLDNADSDSGLSPLLSPKNKKVR